MRRGALLLGLLLLLPACGPGGHLDLGPSPAASETAVAEASALRRIVRRAVPPIEARAAAPAPAGGAETTVALAARARDPWPKVRDRLAGALASGAAQLVLEERTDGGARRVVWHPSGGQDATVRPDVHVAAVLVMRDGEEATDVTIEGSAWTAWAGCDGQARWWVPGWGDDARSGVGRRLDEAIRAAGSDPRRVAVRIDVSATVQTAADWGDVYPLAEEAILTGVGRVSLGSGRRGRRRVVCTETSLEWLAAHQAPDGGWRAADFGAVCDRNAMRVPAADGAGDAGYDVGATGLALLAFLGAGYTSRGRHPYAKTVATGMRYLKSCQLPDGSFAASGAWWAEQHAIATLTLVEIFGMTGSPIYRGAAQAGLDALARVSLAGDRDLAAWTAAAYAGARLANEDAVRRGREPALACDPDRAADVLERCRALSRAEQTEALAVGVFGRILLSGEDPRKGELPAVAPGILERPPVAGAGTDAVHELFATLALFQVGGATWKAWNRRLREVVLEGQRRDGATCCYRGSWDPVGRGGGRFGRVGATALRALTLEVYYRYDKVFGCP